MTRRSFGLLSGLSLCGLAKQLTAQQSESDTLPTFDEVIEWFADEMGVTELPSYPQTGDKIVDAPFTASFRVEIFGEHPEVGEVRLSRRSDGSTRRSSGVKPLGRFGPTLTVTVIEDYGRGMRTAFATLAGIPLPKFGVRKGPLEGPSHFGSGMEFVTTYWAAAEENAGVVAGVRCRRRLMLSPQRERTVEVCISDELHIVTREILKRGEDLVHVYEADEIELGEPDASEFEPPKWPFG